MKVATLWIPRRIIRALEHEAGRHFPRETGGVLLGFADANDRDAIQVVSQAGPGPEAVHSHHRFEPDGTWQQGVIAATYLESGHVTTYLGDWHSHPWGSTRPSHLDRKTAAAIARSRTARAPQPLMLILAGEPDDWAIAAYRYRRRRLRLVETRQC